jgi:hypothetical protein
MKKITSLQTVSAITVLLCLTFQISTIAQSSTTTSEKRNVSGFSKIDVGGAFNVTLVQGNSEEVIVTAESAFINQVITTVEDGTLKIYTKGKIDSNKEMSLTVNFKNLTSVDCSGAIVLKSAGPLKLSQFELESSGTSSTNLDLSVDNLEVNISGTGNLTLTGKASTVDLDISGSGKYKGVDLTADNYDIDISGVGNAEVTAVKLLDVSVSGSGVVKYKGDPQLKQSISGSGKITRL